MRKNKQLRIIIDTNIWISYLISDKLKVIDNLLINSKLRLLFSIELIEELKDTIQKPKLKRYFVGVNAFENMLMTFEPYIDLIDMKSEVDICRDKKDNFLLALAKDGAADYLITGDNDLLVLGSYKETQIISIVDFITIHGI